MAKIPFSIDYRPQIESGEYKVVTGDDRPVRIISWDKKGFGGRTEIVGLVPTPQGDTETVQLYCPDGTLIASSSEKFKLYIVTPEPELSEFEKALLNEFENIWEGPVPKERAKQSATKLLNLARKEIESEIKEQVVHDYWRHTADLQIQAKKEGYNEALKELPRWKKCDPNTIYNTKCNLIINGIGRYIILDGYMIDVDRLEKLPKED